MLGLSSDTRGSRGLLILSQAEEHLTESLLAGAGSTALHTLPTNIYQFSDAVPAGTPRDSVFPIGDELLCFTARLADTLLLLCVVVFIEILNVLPCLLDSLLTLVGELLSTLRDGGVPTLSPLLDDLRLVLVLFFGVGRGKAGVVGD